MFWPVQNPHKPKKPSLPEDRNKLLKLQTVSLTSSSLFQFRLSETGPIILIFVAKFNKKTIFFVHFLPSPKLGLHSKKINFRPKFWRLKLFEGNAAAEFILIQNQNYETVFVAF
jgi:hypothetical protein